jgi:hypothetical protein
MADVTLEDLQKIYVQISTLQAAVKETNRLLKIDEEYASDSIKGLSGDTIANKNSIKNLEKRLADLEKKVKK